MFRVRKDQMEQLGRIRSRLKRRQLVESLEKQGLTVEDDQQNNLLRVRDKAGGVAQISWPAPGVTLVTSGEGRTHRIEHDERDRPAAIVDPAGTRIRFEHDEKDRLVAVHRGDDNSHRFVFDEQDRLSAIVFPDGTQTRYAYDEFGRLTAVADRNRRLTKYEYSLQGRITKITDWQGYETRFEYNGAEYPMAVILPTGDRIDYRIDPETGTASRLINGAEQLTFRLTEDGKHVVEAADGTRATFVLDGERIIEATNEHGTVKIAYDAEGRILSEEFNGQKVEFVRNPAGALVGITTPEGEQIQFLRDREGRLAEVVDWNGGRYRLSYEPSGALASIRYPNGVTSTMSSTPLGLPESLMVKSPRAAQPVCEYRWQNDARDRVAAVLADGVGHNYVYDPEGRLIGEYATNGRIAERYTPDANGNRLEDAAGACTYNGCNQLLTRGAQRFAYDARGNMTYGACPKGNARYHHNGFDRMTAVEGPGWQVRYDYDALGRRIRKYAGQKVTRYVWAGDQLLSEIITEGEQETRRDYLPLAEIRSPLAMREGKEIYCFHNGRRGEPLAVTDARGEPVWKAWYTAWGVCHVQLSKIHQPWRLSGQYSDEETGLYYVLARYYNPELGRFLTPDPLGYEGGSLNFYTYCDGDPLNRIDPTGEIAPLVVVGIIALGAVIGAAVGGGIEVYKQKKQNPDKPLDWGSVAKEAAIGAAVGAIGAAVGIALAPVEAAAAGIAAAVGVGAAVGGVTAAVEHCAEAAIRQKTLTPDINVKDLLIDVAIGAGLGAVTAGVGGLLARRARRLAQAADEVKKLEEARKALPAPSAAAPTPTATPYPGRRPPPPGSATRLPEHPPTVNPDYAKGVDKAQADIPKGHRDLKGNLRSDGVWGKRYLENNPEVTRRLDEFQNGTAGKSVKDLDLRGMTPEQIHEKLTKEGFTHTREPLKAGKDAQGNQLYKKRDGSKTTNPNDPDIVPHDIYVHPDGGMVRVKPEGDPGANIRSEPHASKSVLLDPNKGTGFENEGFKVTNDGQAVPKSPTKDAGMKQAPEQSSGDTENAGYKDNIMGSAHTSLPWLN